MANKLLIIWVLEYLLFAVFSPPLSVKRIKSVEEGRHAQKVDSNKAGGLLPLVYLCRESKVIKPPSRNGLLIILPAGS